MDSLKDLTTFLKTRANGASMSELREVFSDEKELKKFISIGLTNELIIKDGEKRGTRYYSAGMKISREEPKKQTKEKSEKSTVEDHGVECSGWSDIDVYLNSDKPINGQGVFSRHENIGNNNINKPVEFLNSRRKIDTVYIQYDKQKKRNVISQNESIILNNKIAFARDGKNYKMTFFRADNASFKVEEYGGYEELREAIRSIMK